MRRGLIFLALGLLAVTSAKGQTSYQVAPPFVLIEPDIFEDSALVTVALGLNEARVEVTQNGEPMHYRGPFYIYENTTLSAKATADGFESSEITQAFALQAARERLRILQQTPFSTKYPDQAGELMDLKSATSSYRHTGWVGYDQPEVVISFETKGPLQHLGYSFLRDLGAWIGEPAKWTLKASRNGQLIYERSEAHDPSSEGATAQRGYALFPGIEVATRAGGKVTWELTLDARLLPPEHPGAGKTAWIFLDEIVAY